MSDASPTKRQPQPPLQDLQRSVLQLCEREFVDLARAEGNLAASEVAPQEVNEWANEFLAGLRTLKREREEALMLADPRRQAERAMREFASATERGRAALDRLGSDAVGTRLAYLKTQVEMHEGLEQFEVHRREHRDLSRGGVDDDARRTDIAHAADPEFFPRFEEDDGAVERGRDLHRRGIVVEFARENFLGLVRGPTIRELALLSLYFDPDQGCTASRGGRTAYAILKAEMDAIRFHVNSDAQAARVVAEGTVEAGRSGPAE